MQPSTESSVKSSIQGEVAKVIRNKCQCDFQDTSISQALLLCEEQEPNKVVYRASIVMYDSYSATELVGYIEDWVKQGGSVSIGVVVVKFDPNCPVRISDFNDPICFQTSVTTANTQTSTLPPHSLDTSAIVITSVACTIITTAMILISVLIIVCLLNKRKIR